MTQQKVADEINRMMTIRNGEGRECVVSELDPANAARLENLTSDELNAEHWAILTELVETLFGSVTRRNDAPGCPFKAGGDQISRHCLCDEDGPA